VWFRLNEEVKRGTQPTFTSYFTCNFTRLMMQRLAVQAAF
jgi:hypothetical protein